MLTKDNKFVTSKTVKKIVYWQPNDNMSDHSMSRFIGYITTSTLKYMQVFSTQELLFLINKSY